jgi:hypothetical protein
MTKTGKELAQEATADHMKNLERMREEQESRRRMAMGIPPVPKKK